MKRDFRPLRSLFFLKHFFFPVFFITGNAEDLLNYLFRFVTIAVNILNSELVNVKLTTAPGQLYVCKKRGKLIASSGSVAGIILNTCHSNIKIEKRIFFPFHSQPLQIKMLETATIRFLPL